MDEATYIGAITRAPQLAVLQAQVADALAKGATLHCGGAQPARARATGSSPRCSPASNHTMELMREESFGPIIGIQKVRGDDEARGADERHALRPDGRRLHAATRPRARELLAQVNAGTRLLELLRPRQPAAALVGPWRFGRRPDAVDLRHPDLHPAQGLAPAPALMSRLADALRPGPHAARRRQRPAVVRVPDGPRRAAARALRGAATATWRATTRPAPSARRPSAISTSARWPGAAPTNGSRCAATTSTRASCRASAHAALELVARHRDAGDLVLLTTATCRFLSELTAVHLGIAQLIATECETGRRRPLHRPQPGRARTCAKARCSACTTGWRASSWTLVGAGVHAVQRFDQRPAAAAAPCAARWR